MHKPEVGINTTYKINMRERITWWIIEYQLTHDNIPTWLNRIFYWIRERNI